MIEFRYIKKVIQSSLVRAYLPYVSHDAMDPIVTCHTYPGGCQLRSRP